VRDALPEFGFTGVIVGDVDWVDVAAHRRKHVQIAVHHGPHQAGVLTDGEIFEEE
jgi:hypothetical protein